MCTCGPHSWELLWSSQSPQVLEAFDLIFAFYGVQVVITQLLWFDTGVNDY